MSSRSSPTSQPESHRLRQESRPAVTRRRPKPPASSSAPAPRTNPASRPVNGSVLLLLSSVTVLWASPPASRVGVLRRAGRERDGRESEEGDERRKGDRQAKFLHERACLGAWGLSEPQVGYPYPLGQCIDNWRRFPSDFCKRCCRRRDCDDRRRCPGRTRSRSATAPRWCGRATFAGRGDDGAGDRAQGAEPRRAPIAHRPEGPAVRTRGAGRRPGGGRRAGAPVPRGPGRSGPPRRRVGRGLRRTRAAGASSPRSPGSPPTPRCVASWVRAPARRRSGAATAGAPEWSGAPRLEQRPEPRRMVSDLQMADLVPDDGLEHLAEGASSRRQLKLIDPSAAQLAQRVRWPRMVRRGYVVPADGAGEVEPRADLGPRLPPVPALERRAMIAGGNEDAVPAPVGTRSARLGHQREPLVEVRDASPPGRRARPARARARPAGVRSTAAARARPHRPRGPPRDGGGRPPRRPRRRR